jgi:hypothetical protein
MGWVAAILVIGAGAFLAGHTIGEEKKVADQRVYELRTYTTHEGRLEALHKRFREHTTKNGMYWVPTDEKLSKNTLIYVVSHESPEAAKKSWDAFRNDPAWKTVQKESEKDGPIVAKVESVYMSLVDYSPLKQ